ncbi:MAG: DUF4091 domain-containing protein [Planctomycetes bacterium]|nr:DUF4091 domain-containing protein [Planctomycetota bacterium]
MKRNVTAAAIMLLAACGASGWDIRIYPEFFRPGPHGGIMKADYKGEEPAALKPTRFRGYNAINIDAPRGGYVSFHMAVTDDKGGEFHVSYRAESPDVEIDVFREWFHGNGQGEWYADALIPAGGAGTVKDGMYAGMTDNMKLPDSDMQIKGQTTAALWVDIWVSPEAKPGPVNVVLELGGQGRMGYIQVRVNVLKVQVPQEDTLCADHNTYGVGWVHSYFPLRRRKAEAAGKAFNGSDEFFSCVHDMYKLLYEHRALFHDLGYNHSGGVNGLFAPELEGEGEGKRVKGWETFDRHFGPLLDGSAFRETRRGPRPIECMYLTINPEWPGSYLYWGTPTYEKEFVNVVSAMEKHFREKGWTETEFEMFFNHKKRYKGFEWDGDETRFPKDNVCFKEFGRLLHKAVPEKSPVRFVFRHDASWLMRQQMDELKGVVNFWVCGGGIFSFYPEAPALLKGRGDKVWIYGGSPSIFGSTLDATEMPVDAWMKGIDGYIRWLTTSPDSDAWGKSRGNRECMFYPGAKFGLDEILPSIRLKIQRNCLQDIALLDLVETRKGAAATRAKTASFAGVTPADWWNGAAECKKQDPWEWSNASLGEAMRKPKRSENNLDGRWWLAVREYALQEAVRTRTAKKAPGPARAVTERARGLVPYRLDEPTPPELREGSVKGSLEEQLKAVGAKCAETIDAETCRRIVTARAEEWLFRKHPKDQWFASDNWDVNFPEFVNTKKLLIRLSRTAEAAIDCNLWMRPRDNPEKINMIIRQKHGLSQWYDFGQLAIDPDGDMKKTLEGETTVVRNRRGGMISVLVPLKTAAGETVGFIEVCGRL